MPSLQGELVCGPGSRSPSEKWEDDVAGRLDIAYTGDEHEEEPDFWIMSWSGYRPCLIEDASRFLRRFFPGKDVETLCEAVANLPDADPEEEAV